MTSMMMMMMVSVLLSLLLHRHQELRFNWYDKVKMRTIATLSATTCISQYQKGKTSLDLNEARDDGGFAMQ